MDVSFFFFFIYRTKARHCPHLCPVCKLLFEHKLNVALQNHGIGFGMALVKQTWSLRPALENVDCTSPTVQ